MNTMRFTFASLVLLLCAAVVARADTSHTVSWANSYCNRDSQWECAEFSARSLAAGGYIPLDPLASTDVYANYHGYNLRMVQGLHGYLRSIGWKETYEAPANIKAGQPIFGNAGAGAWSHACIGVGNGLIDCHNSAACGVQSRYWFSYANSILAPPGDGSAPVPASLAPVSQAPISSSVPSSDNTQCATIDVHFRSCADTSCSISGTIPQGHAVTVLGPQANAGGYLWKEVSWAGMTGWVASVYLGACSSGQVAASTQPVVENAVASPSSETGTSSSNGGGTPAWVVVVCLLVGLVAGVLLTAGVLWLIVRRSGGQYERVSPSPISSSS